MHEVNNNPSASDSELPSLTVTDIKVNASTLSTSPLATAGAQRKIGIAVDLTDESASLIIWSIKQYLRPEDDVTLLHVRPTSVLYGADWGYLDLFIVDTNQESLQKLENKFDAFITTKVSDLSQPLVKAHIPFKIHIVKDHEAKERLCLEVERLGLTELIIGTRGFGAAKYGIDGTGRIGSVSDYCRLHCVCPLVAVWYPDDERNGVNDILGILLDDDDEEET